MKFLLILFLGITLNAQTSSEENEKKLLLELGVSSDFSTAVAKQNPAVGFGIWYRYPIENEARLELGGNFKSGPTLYQFNYGKDDEVYAVDSKGYFLNLGGRLVKEFKIKNQRVEWVSELTLSTLFFDGTGIPDDPIPQSDNNRAVNIAVDAESVSTLQFGQGFRIWKGNLGFGVKGSYAPYSLWYKSTIPHRFNVLTAEASIFVKL